MDSVVLTILKALSGEGKVASTRALVASSNWVIASGIHPRVVFVFFRDTNLTDVLFRLDEQFRWSLDRVAHDREDELNSVVATWLPRARIGVVVIAAIAGVMMLRGALIQGVRRIEASLIGHDVEVIRPEPGLPDMVFAAKIVADATAVGSAPRVASNSEALSRNASPAWVVEAGHPGTVTEPPVTAQPQ